MIIVDRNLVQEPSILKSTKVENLKSRIANFYNMPMGLRSQKRLNSAMTLEVKANLKEPLKELFKNKCAYCESLISSGEIDNFRPKSGARGLKKEFSNDHYWWLTYEWYNLYYSCHNCNRFKSTWFPLEGERAQVSTDYYKILIIEKTLLVDPCNDNPEDHFIYDNNGKIDFLSRKGRVSIEILKLNRVDLVQGRKLALKHLQVELETFLNYWRKSEENWIRLKEIALNWEGIINGASQKPYVGIQKQVLSEWLMDHPEIGKYFRNKEYEYILEDRVFYGQVVGVVKDEGSPKLRELNESEKRNIEVALKLDSLKRVYLDKIELKNYKCFSNLKIIFNQYVQPVNPNEEISEPWLLFLGENGVGKSSILQAIAISLVGDEYRKKLDININALLKKKTREGYIKLYLKGEEANPIIISFSKENGIQSNQPHQIANLLGYGSIRLLPKNKIAPEKIKGNLVKVKNLFDYSVSLADANYWLLNLSEDNFNRAAIALKDLMMLADEDKLIRNEKVYIVTSSGRFDITELSDGYQSLFALSVDIMSTLIGENVNFEIAEGIVLVDEIGTHLHPRWKMEVVSRLRKTFPKIQFVVTTHEPLCLRGLNEGEVVVLTKDENKKVIALTELPNPNELRIDQILTSEFFGLRSTMDPKIEEQFQKYYELLSIEEQNRTDEQRKLILEFNEIMPKIEHLGDSLREELIYYVVDELLAQKVKKEGLEIKETLKAEAVKRVQSLWNLINESE